MPKIAYIHLRGLLADRPAGAGLIPGTLYFAFDTGATTRWSGVVWQTYSGTGGSGDGNWIPLVDGSEPPVFITDGAGVLMLVAGPS